MRLSQQQINDVVAHLNKFKRAPCPVCNTDKWTVSDILFQLPEYETPVRFPRLTSDPPLGAYGGLDVLAGLAGSPASTQVFPVVPVTCATCGYVYFLSGIALNIVAASK